jgi:hypothetical protein
LGEFFFLLKRFKINFRPEKVEPPKVNIRRESTSDKENISARKKVALGVKNDAQPTKPMVINLSIDFILKHNIHPKSYYI